MQDFVNEKSSKTVSPQKEEMKLEVVPEEKPTIDNFSSENELNGEWIDDFSREILGNNEEQM